MLPDTSFHYSLRWRTAKNENEARLDTTQTNAQESNTDHTYILVRFEQKIFPVEGYSNGKI